VSALCRSRDESWLKRIADQKQVSTPAGARGRRPESRRIPDWPDRHGHPGLVAC
jgi:hypothetical protein